jgi:hypothetical protein
MNTEIFNFEVSQWPLSFENLNADLRNNFPDFSIKLIQGFSDKVLKKLESEKFDLIIIDGGHSFETVKSDWLHCSKLLSNQGSIIFDDYTNTTGFLKGGIGVKLVVDNVIDRSVWEITKLSSRDFFLHDWGLLSTRMVQVKKQGSNRARNGSLM